MPKSTELGEGLPAEDGRGIWREDHRTEGTQAARKLRWVQLLAFLNEANDLCLYGDKYKTMAIFREAGQEEYSFYLSKQTTEENLLQVLQRLYKIDGHIETYLISEWL